MDDPNGRFVNIGLALFSNMKMKRNARCQLTTERVNIAPYGKKKQSFFSVWKII